MWLIPVIAIVVLLAVGGGAWAVIAASSGSGSTGGVLGIGGGGDGEGGDEAQIRAALDGYVAELNDYDFRGGKQYLCEEARALRTLLDVLAAIPGDRDGQGDVGYTVVDMNVTGDTATYSADILSADVRIADAAPGSARRDGSRWCLLS
ncbi:MAG: hypothetical protein QM662_12200 [Gordonia sp. (in: high G+C Gram-positive bacteria)]